MSHEVRIAVEGCVGRLTLTRPQALHALTLGMCEAIIAALLVWRDDPRVEVILIDHEGGRGFCAGGDIRALVDSLQGDGVLADRFFHTEYQLDHLLFTYPKMTVSVMDGVVMGGGVGIALPCRYRIATENTVFAMPECGIGLFPDVGGGRYLGRLGATGVWLGLTGARIRAADCLALDIATHAVAAADLQAFKAELCGEGLPDLWLDAGMPTLTERAADRDRLFDKRSVPAILDGLDRDGGEWAAHQAAILRTKSPMMLAATHRLLGESASRRDFADELAVEYGLSLRTIRRPDFFEGVRAVVIDKDNNPRWSPATLADVSDAMVDTLFEPLPQPWTPLK